MIDRQQAAVGRQKTRGKLAENTKKKFLSARRFFCAEKKNRNTQEAMNRKSCKGVRRRLDFGNAPLWKEKLYQNLVDRLTELRAVGAPCVYDEYEKCACGFFFPRTPPAAD